MWNVNEQMAGSEAIIGGNPKLALTDRLLELRRNSGRTQLEAASHLGITRSAYGMYELGSREPDNDMLLKIATMYNVSVDYLLGRTDNPVLPVDTNRPLTPAEQIAAMGIDIAFARGGLITQEDVEFFKAYLATKGQQRRTNKRKR